MSAESATEAPTEMTRADALLVLSTCGTMDEARGIARALVEENLASCVNIMKVSSLFRWRGKVEETEEHLLIVKTMSSVYWKVENRIRALHSYDLPEIIALKIEKGFTPYLKWVKESVCMPSD